MPKHYCPTCNQPMRKMGPDVYVCPQHATSPAPPKPERAPTTRRRRTRRRVTTDDDS